MDHQQRTITRKRGVLQGDPLPPTLFDFVIHEVVNNLNQNTGANLGNSNSPNLALADHRILFRETVRDLQKHLARFSMAIYGLTLNERKFKAVHIRSRKRTKSCYTAKNQSPFSEKKLQT